MKRIIRFIMIILSQNLYSQTKVTELAKCLEEHSEDPKEYILNLFKTNDIVIIGERDHRDTLQYDLLLEIIEDKRFIEEVGHVYTEVGCINRTNWANEVIKATYDSDDEFEKELIKLYRELDFTPLWEKYNMYKYLKGIYDINKNLESSKKISIGLTDISFDWKDINRNKYLDFERGLNTSRHHRDSIMAMNFIKLFGSQVYRNGTKKALLIQSFPHAINLNLNSYGIDYRSAGSYVVEKYKDKVKIVAFNSVYFGKYNSQNWNLIDDGRWDAAYDLFLCKNVGFDILNTPFGNTKFEEGYRIDFEKQFDIQLKYEDIIDGILFYRPFYDFECTIGIPNIVDKNFSKELINRVIIYQDRFLNRFWLSFLKFYYKKSIAKYYNTKQTFHPYNKKSLKDQMNKWIENNNTIPDN